MLDLPFDDDSAKAAYLGHLLEHLERDEVPRALRELRRVLRGDGVAMVVGPCLDLAASRTDWNPMVSLIWPGKRYEGPGGHKWPSTGRETFAMLAASEWVVNEIDVADVPEWWPCPNRVGWQFAAEITPT